MLLEHPAEVEPVLHRVDERVPHRVFLHLARGGRDANRSIVSRLAMRSSLAGSAKEMKVTELPSTS